MGYKLKTKTLKTRGPDGAVRTVPALRGEPADPAEIEAVKSEINKLGQDVAKTNNDMETPAPAGQVWTATEDGAGWAVPQGGGGDIIPDPDDPNGGIVISGTLAETDKSLTLDNYAADAKVVGEKITHVTSEISKLETEKLTTPENPSVGKTLKVKSVNEDGTFVCEWADGGAGGVTDVRANGTSVVTNGVANIATAGQGSYGIIRGAINNLINTRTSGAANGYQSAITLSNVDYAVKKVMSAPVGNGSGMYSSWTAEEQQAAQQRLGILSVEGVAY